ncbi:Ddl-like protein [Caulifigura coniformis]|uniref:Ddl-like protein n=1 Tax=Caulifigura coniformis TaxID=2527983 RepID=A0A517SFL9_9PLAN|nr:D-alanine--D-alanine ligase [Caulifigura coniformis]QDT54926.1 Ddl-like protein [Caulifigura coniformis]
MNIGFTYDLRSDYLAMGYSPEATAEFDSEITVDAIAGTLEELGHSVARIGHVQSLAQRLVAGERWDLVFNICEGLRGIAREAQVPALLDAYDIPYTFSDPLVSALTLHKGMTKSVVRDAGVRTPGFALVASPDDVAGVTLTPPLFAKPVAEGTGKGVSPLSRVRSLDQLRPVCEHLLSQFQQPVLVEEFLPGREFTIGVRGTGSAATVIGTYEILLLPAAEAGIYSYANKENSEEVVRYELRRPDDPIVAEAESLTLAAWRALGCRDAGRIDVRCDAGGRPSFIEVNPLAGLHPTHSDLPMICAAVGVSYRDLIAGIVESASQRIRR